MDVSEAVSSRSSVRSFSSKIVEDKLIKELLVKSARSPSGGNIQPWRIYVLNHSKVNEFLDHQKSWNKNDIPSYEIYPPKLKEPYRSSRYELGEQMYKTLGIDRDDKEGRLKQVLKNFEFFGAQSAFFCFVDKQMGPPQWSDLGMFLQTFMLLAREAGLDTCAQEAWSIKNNSVSDFVNAKVDEILFCGMCIGYKDRDAKINTLKSPRRPVSDWAVFL